MQLPEELWDQIKDRQVIREFVEAFYAHPLVLTDKLANTIYFNGRAEELFGDHAEAIVNRLSFSLLGFGRKEKTPVGLMHALLGEGVPWRGIVNVSSGEIPRLIFAEASAIRTADGYLCGVIRFGTEGHKL